MPLFSGWERRTDFTDIWNGTNFLNPEGALFTVGPGTCIPSTLLAFSLLLHLCSSILSIDRHGNHHHFSFTSLLGLPPNTLKNVPNLCPNNMVSTPCFHSFINLSTQQLFSENCLYVWKWGYKVCSRTQDVFPAGVESGLGIPVTEDISDCINCVCLPC